MREGSAFTLIELLVVIAIIALLIALLMPAMTRVKELSRRTVCRSDVHQVVMALVQYASQNQSFFPSGKRNAVGGIAGEHCIWISDSLYNYVYALAGTASGPVDLTVGVPDRLFTCVNLPGFGYHNQYGWVIGYNYLGNHPRMNDLGNFRSPIRLGDGGALPIWVDLNNWCPGSWTFIPHTAHGGIGRGWPDYYNFDLGGVDTATVGSEGGNVGCSDGSARWKLIGETSIYETGEWGYGSYLCRW